jgi:hypothetical protein
MVGMTSLVATGSGGDLIVGFVVGMAIGILVGPAFRSWVARREWNEASRRARLTDEVLARMQDEPPYPDGGVPDLDAWTSEPPKEPNVRRIATHRWPQR